MARALGHRGEDDQGIEARLQGVIGDPEGVKAPALRALRQVPWRDMLHEVRIGQPDVNSCHRRAPAVALRPPTIPPAGRGATRPGLQVWRDAGLLRPAVLVAREAHGASAVDGRGRRGGPRLRSRRHRLGHGVAGCARPVEAPGAVWPALPPSPTVLCVSGPLIAPLAARCQSPRHTSVWLTFKGLSDPGSFGSHREHRGTMCQHISPAETVQNCVAVGSPWCSAQTRLIRTGTRVHPPLAPGDQQASAAPLCPALSSGARRQKSGGYAADNRCHPGARAPAAPISRCRASRDAIYRS